MDQEKPSFHDHGRNPGKPRERENKGGKASKNRLITAGIRATLQTRIFLNLYPGEIKMKITVCDIIRRYFIKLDDKILKQKLEITQDHAMMITDPNNYTCFNSTWQEELEKDQKRLKDLEEEKEKIKNYLNKNWDKLEEMEIK